jgi:two-component system, cell cycle sensor histidine kinase and response regulator CckA
MTDATISGGAATLWWRLKTYALALAAIVVALGLAWLFRNQMSAAALVIGAILAAFGIYALAGLVTGILRHDGNSGAQLFFDAISDARGDAFVVTDEKGRAVYANGPYLKLAAKSGANRLVGFDMLYAGHADFAEPIFQLAKAAHEGKELQRDVRVAAGAQAPGAAEDSARWLRLKVAPLMASGKQGHSLWTLADISSDRAHQENAFSRLQFIITYLDHAPAGFFSTLPGGKIDYINATLANWLGLDLAEIQKGNLHVDDVLGKDAGRLLLAVDSGGKPTRTDRFHMTVKTKKGDPIALELVNRLDFNTDGQPLPARTMVMQRPSGTEASRPGEVSTRDTARVAANAVMMATPVGVAEIDGAGNVVFANPLYLAMSPEAKLGSPISAALDKAYAARLAKAIEDARAKPGLAVQCEVNFAGDPPRAIHLTVTALGDDRMRLTVFASDRTESKSLEVQLGQAQKMQAVGQLASGIAHDFNNVLTPILGFADLLLTKLRPTDPSFGDVQNIKQNASRAANLVRQLLAFSRKQTLQPKVHSLTDAMSDLDNLLGRVLGEKVKLSINHGRDLGLVMVDIHQFEQVIINLAVNARDAMPGGGTLSVKTRNLDMKDSGREGHVLPAQDYVVCEVTDTGTGIPKAILEKIWEPFFSTKEVGKGTGLGLSMVYGIVKQTGGFIYCDSIQGRGTTFKIYLPRHYPEPVTDAPVEAKVAKAPVREDFTGKGRILVVEDEDSVRAFAVKALTSRGFTVLEANSGEVGLEVIEDDKDGFELILSDVVMPEMDGPTFLAELRKRGNLTKFIFMSGYAEDAFERHLENPDDFAFLQKPFTLKQLIEKVKGVMES